MTAYIIGIVSLVVLALLPTHTLYILWKEGRKIEKEKM